MTDTPTHTKKNILPVGLDSDSEEAKVIKDLGNLPLPTGKGTSVGMKYFERLEDGDARRRLLDRRKS